MVDREKGRLGESGELGHALTMQLTLPKAIEDRVSPRAAALVLAVGMFITEEVTLGQAA